MNDTIIDLFCSWYNMPIAEIPKPPQELIDFRKLSKYEKIKQSYEFYKQDFIQKYLEDKWKAELNNKVLYEELNNLLKIEKDQSRIDLLKTKIKNVFDYISKCENVFIALRLADIPNKQSHRQEYQEAQRIDWNN